MVKLRAWGLDAEIDMMTSEDLGQFASQKQLTSKGELTDRGESLHPLHLTTLLTHHSLGEHSASRHRLCDQST